MRFSERYGYKPVKSSVQIDSIDDPLRNSLWSALKIVYWDRAYYSEGLYGQVCSLSDTRNKPLNEFCSSLWLHFFKKPLDTLSDDWEEVHSQIRDFFFKGKWYEIYDFIEFVGNRFTKNDLNLAFVKACNTFLEREVSAYRFVDFKIRACIFYLLLPYYH